MAYKALHALPCTYIKVLTMDIEIYKHDDSIEYRYIVIIDDCIYGISYNVLNGLTNNIRICESNKRIAYTYNKPKQTLFHRLPKAIQCMAMDRIIQHKGC